MSADNWGTCPRCKQRADEAAKAAKLAAGEAYGKVPNEEYLRLVEEAKKPPSRDLTTLREDYELGTDANGEFYVRYRCGCETCGLVFRFTHEAQVPL